MLMLMDFLHVLSVSVACPDIFCGIMGGITFGIYQNVDPLLKSPASDAKSTGVEGLAGGN